MLTNLLDGWFKMNVGEGAFYAAFGFIFVFLGITVLILLFTVLGKIMDTVNKKRAKKAEDSIPVISTEASFEAQEAGLAPETIAVISAALAAYYDSENTKCDFVVKRIRKI